jgi:hypothetical protein
MFCVSSALPGGSWSAGEYEILIIHNKNPIPHTPKYTHILHTTQNLTRTLHIPTYYMYTQTPHTHTQTHILHTHYTYTNTHTLYTHTDTTHTHTQTHTYTNHIHHTTTHTLHKILSSLPPSLPPHHVAFPSWFQGKDLSISPSDRDLVAACPLRYSQYKSPWLSNLPADEATSWLPLL